MISSRIKNNIYALVSLSVIMITMISFVLMTGFLVDMNDLVFNMSQSSSYDTGVSLDMSGYENVKDLLNNDKNN